MMSESSGKGGEPTEKKDKLAERKLFNNRRESTRMMAMFNKRYFNSLRKNWKIKQEDHLLPKAETIFDLIDENISGIDILKDPTSIKNWHQVVDDEEFVDRDIQETIAILSWVYWQRLEGYETLDVSLSRERLVEDIGCIQQFYNAADGLVLEYQRCFDIQLPIDIMCVYGLYQYFHTNFRHFIMVPNQTRYEYIPAWISVAHEVAHIAIDEINEDYHEWQMKEMIRKRRIEIMDFEEHNFEPRQVREQLREGDVPQVVNEIASNFRNLMEQICDEAAKDEIGKFLEYERVILSGCEYLDSLGSKPKPVLWRDHLSFYESACKGLDKMSEAVSGVLDSIIYSITSDHVIDMWKKLQGIRFTILSILEITLEEKLSLKLFGNPERGDIGQFFSNWKEIVKRAGDIAETVLHVLEGESGLMYLSESNIEDIRNIGDSEHILADIIATLIAGEFYLYSLAFYRFLPSVFPSEEGIILRKQQVPMSLRLLICLETLKHSVREDMSEMSNLVDCFENSWIQLVIDYNNSKTDEEFQVTKEREEKKIRELKDKISDNNCRMTADLLWSLIESIMEEDFLLEKEYKELLHGAEEGREELKDKFNISHFNYMKHALGNVLRRMLQDPDGFLVGTCYEGNCLKELIELVKGNLINPTELFTTKKRYETIKQMREKLIKGELVFEEGELEIKPRNILSAYVQIYFGHILLNSKKEDYINAFNTAVMSMAWTQHALERFHDGNI